MIFAKNSGIGNISEFSNCVGSHKYSTLVHQNYDLAISLGLTSTPSFVILSEFKSPMVIVGSQPFQTFDYHDQEYGFLMEYLLSVISRISSSICLTSRFISFDLISISFLASPIS